MRGVRDEGRRKRAVELRCEGRSYREIESELGVPKSTLSSWLKDVALTDEHQRQLDERQRLGGTTRGDAVHALRVRRTAQIEGSATAEVGDISDRELFLIGVTAYCASQRRPEPPDRRVVARHRERPYDAPVR